MQVRALVLQVLQVHIGMLHQPMWQPRSSHEEGHLGRLSHTSTQIQQFGHLELLHVTTGNPCEQAWAPNLLPRPVQPASERQLCTQSDAEH